MIGYAYLKQVASEMGASVERLNAYRADTINVDAPQGMVWTANGCHHLCYSSAHTRITRNGYADLLQRMDYGLEVCMTEDCDCCLA